jgi:hypothetical protein
MREAAADRAAIPHLLVANHAAASDHGTPLLQGRGRGDLVMRGRGTD